MNDTMANVVASVAGLVWLICFILVLIQMFQHGRTGLGIVCIVLAFCCGLGGLVAFIVGWVNSRPWRITNLMTVWTVAWVVEIVVGATNPAMFQSFRDRIPIGQ